MAKMAWKLKTKAGKARYAKRKSTVEAVTGEWKLVTLAFNLKRMHLLATA